MLKLSWQEESISTKNEFPFMLPHDPLNNLDTSSTAAMALMLPFDHTMRAQIQVGSHTVYVYYFI